MKGLIFILFAGSIALAAESPYIIEARVRTDLDSLLARMIPAEQYLLQVNAEVRVENERKMVEGEESQDIEAAREVPPPDPMPGFVPETADPPLAPGKHQRQVFRSVETPMLASLRVNVGLDQELPLKTKNQAKNLIQTYLFSNYPNLVRLGFMDVSMLKPKKDPPVAPIPEPAADEEEQTESLQDLAVRYFPWLALGLIAIFALFRRAAPEPKQAKSTMRPKWANPNSRSVSPMAGQQSAMAPATSPSSPFAASASVSASARTRFLDKVITHANAFRAYYDILSPEFRAEVESILGGPAFESVMESVVTERPRSSGPSGDVEEMALVYETQFNEFVQAKQSQEKQFFGFLNQLTREQLGSLMTFENDITVCLMLRFMKPVQCAAVLDSLTPERRKAVLVRLDEAQRIPLSEISVIEKEVREAVRRLPSHAIGPGPSQVDFWANVLSESSHQAEILQDLESTNPGISPALQKFKFSLEDAATLPDDFLKRVTSEIDNEELALALSTCTNDVAEVVLSSLPDRRSSLLQQQMNAARSAPRDRAAKARNTFTKKLREAMA